MFDFLSSKFSSIFSRIAGQRTLTADNMKQILDQISDALLESDVPYNLVQDFVTSIKQAEGKKIIADLKPGEQLLKLTHDKIIAFLGGKQHPINFEPKSVVMVLGLQGSGKTTSVAKIAARIKKEKQHNVLLASIDYTRPAAREQLAMLAARAGLDCYQAKADNAIDAAQEIYAYYKRGNFDLLLLDTAGRMHIDSALLQELRSVNELMCPRYKLLVLDAMTGQESLNVARGFDQGVGFDYAILTKMDSDTRGGAVFSFCYALKKRIIFIGTGEHIEDLDTFYPERIANRMLGMGDLQTLVEKAEEKIKKAEQEKVEKSLFDGRMTLQDFADQLSMVNRMGSLTHLVKLLPGMGHISPEILEKGQVEMKKFRAIISSMTSRERINPRILDASRKKRIAGGAGVSVADINILLQRFEQTQQYAKLFKKFGLK
jgi:signal recognition particle subunit SRP54